MKVKVSDVINERLDAFQSTNYLFQDGLRQLLKDYLSDIDEEMAAIRKRGKEYKESHDYKCWCCGLKTMVDTPGLPGWTHCVSLVCGATACKHPTRRHSLPKIHWGGGQFMTPKHLFKPLDPMMWETRLGMARQ